MAGDTDPFLDSPKSPKPQTKSLYCSKIRRSYQVRKIPRRRSHYVSFGCLFILVPLCIAFIPFVSPGQSKDPIQSGDCDLYRSTGAERAFAIDKRVIDNLSYVQAKAIQITWDFALGLGGRVLHAWIFQKVFLDNLVYLMERSSVSQKLFIASSLASSTWRTAMLCAQSLWSTRDWRVTITMLWALLALLHILGFPLLWSASSGYTNPTLPYIQLPDNSSVPYSFANITGCLLIVDGDRLGLGTDFPIIGGPTVVPVEGTIASVNQSVSTNFANVYSYMWNAQKLISLLAANGDPVSSTDVPQFYPQTYPGWNNGYGYSENPVPWTFTNKTALYPGTVPYNSSLRLNGALLNVTGSLLHFRDNKTCSEDDYDCYSPTGAYRLCVNNEAMPQSWTPSTFCAADSSFTWGFSSSLAFLGLIFELVWTITMYAFWLHANRHSILRRYGFDLRCSYENAALLTAVIEEALGDGDSCLDRKQMHEVMKQAGDVGLVIQTRSPGGGPVEVYMTAHAKGKRTRESVERFLRRRGRHRPQTSPLLGSGEKKRPAFWDSGRPFITDASKGPSSNIQETSEVVI